MLTGKSHKAPTLLRRKRLLLSLLLAEFLLVPGWSWALETMDTPVELQIKLLVQASTYDRNQKNKPPPGVLRIGVIHTESTDSQKVADEIMGQFAEKHMTVRKYELQLESITFKDASNLKEATRSRNIHMYYIAPGNRNNLSTIIDLGKEMKIMTMTGVADYVYAGTTIGVQNNGSRPQFLYNQQSAEENAADFDANFLRMVKFVK
ncbi:MAG: DUF4154 domain-containing protein [SAR324 cluster bacterium]|nr:DUF4154 domain-containing protein [SAR324 cluster bacterium]